MAPKYLPRHKIQLLCTTLLAVLVRNYARAETRALLIVHRHGARPPLTKDPTDPSEERLESSAVALYPQGIERLKALGDYVNQTYPSQLSFRRVHAFSSNVSRTLMSSRAFLSGLMPQTPYAPTYVFADSESDWILRGYATCPQLERNFLKFTDTDEYRKMEKEYADLVQDLAERLKEPPVEPKFENVFNVYDQYTIIKEGYDESSDGKNDPAISDEEMANLTNVAGWYESSKFFHGTKDTRAAAGLLTDMLARLSNAVDEDGAFHIIEYSAHYPTLLTLLAEMQDPSSDKIEHPADKIPGFGAALFVELNKDGKDFSVRLKWFQGGKESPSANTTSIRHRRKPCNDNSPEDGCPWAEFQDMYTSIELNDFCQACGSSEGACVRSRGRSTPFFVLVGLAVGVIIGICIACLAARVRTRKTVHNFSSDHIDDGYVGD